MGPGSEWAEPGDCSWFGTLGGQVLVGLALLCPTGAGLQRMEVRGAADNPTLQVECVPIHYDYQALSQEMRQEGLPEEFVETILTGWWTTCLEVLPGKERARGRW